MHVAAGAQFDRGVHAHAVRRFDHPAIIADVLDAGFGIGGDEMARCGVGRIVPTRRRDRHRDGIEAVAVAQFVSGMDDLLARCDVDDARLDRMAHRLDPAVAHLLDAAAHAERIDLVVAGEPAHQHRNVEPASLAVDDVGEQESASVFRRNAAAELPTHQRVHLGVLVDLAGDLDQQAGFAQRRDVVVQVGIRAFVRRDGIRQRRHGISSQKSPGQTGASHSAPASCPASRMFARRQRTQRSSMPATPAATFRPA